METDLSVKIPPPPRRLTRTSRRRLRRELAETWVGKLAFCVVILWFAAFAFFISRANQDVLLAVRHRTTTGRVTLLLREDESPHGVCFAFTLPDGREYEDFSVTSDRDSVPEPGTEVTIQYYPPNPAISRIAGMRCRILPWAVFAVPVVAALIAFPIADLVIRLLRRRRQLCENGVATTGILLEQDWFLALFFRRRVSRAKCRYTVMRCRFEDASGRTHKGGAVTRRSPFALEPGDEVTVIYDQDNPKRSIVVEALGLEFVGGAKTGLQD
jgi:hypothetical protein